MLKPSKKSLYRGNKFGRKYTSKALCLEDVLNNENVSFECVVGQFEPEVKKNTVSTRDKADAFEWYITDWNATVESTPTGQFIKSPIFESDEGYQFEMRVYPNGRYTSNEGYLSVYAYQGVLLKFY